MYTHSNSRIFNSCHVINTIGGLLLTYIRTNNHHDLKRNLRLMIRGIKVLDL